MSNKSFEKLYAYAQLFSHEHNVSLEDVAQEVFRFHSSDLTQSKIFSHLNSMSWAESYQDNDKSNSNRPTFDQDIWLIVGETGQGKSSFVNYICSREVAPEGPGINSQTSEPKLYNAINSHLWLIDTPGLFDTRKDMKNDVVMTKIIQMVESKFEHNSHIDAIFLIWNPVMTMRLRLDEMIENLINSFGSSALKSLIIIVNKETTVWKKDKRYNDAVDELEKDNKKKGYNFPIITLDVKIKLTLSDMRILKQNVNQITPYNEKDFSAYRKQCFYRIYREIKQRDQEEEEKERRIRETAEERVRQEEERIRQENERIRQEKERLREEKEKMRQEEEERRRRLREQEEKNAQNQRMLENEVSRLRNEISSSHYQSYSYDPPNYNFAYSIPFSSKGYSTPSSGSTSAYSNVNASSSGPTKHDGTLDMRFPCNKIDPTLKMDGTPDMRFSCNKHK